MGRKSTLSKRTQRLAEENLANARKTAKSARKTAESGWHDVSAAFGSAVDRTQHYAGDVQSKLVDARSRLQDAQGEGLRRTKAAKEALAGKRTARRSPWVAGAAVLGVVFGALGVIYARRVAKARERAQAENVAAAVAADLAATDFRAPRGDRDSGAAPGAAPGATVTSTPGAESTSSMMSPSAPAMPAAATPKVVTPRSSMDTVKPEPNNS